LNNRKIVTTPATLTLSISCPDGIGIVAAVSRFLAECGGWIVEANHHTNGISGRFFMRNVLLTESLQSRGVDAARLRREFAPIAATFNMDWALSDSAVRKRMVIMASRHDHCLVDLLYRWKSGELACEIPCVIANHADLADLVGWHGIPFHHVPVPADDAGKQQAFDRVESLFAQARGDLLVLARYMQILPPALCAQQPGRIINIHHSFLPSFVGARPYAQALARGVKLIGATAHYVTATLDAGPIIEQDVVRIDHGDTEEDLVRYGRDIEKAVLARALKFHLEDRVLLDGQRTVVFR
jgi:formyltetrahydrofolate deformylase